MRCNVDALSIKNKIDAYCVDMVNIDAFCNKNIDAFSIDLVYIDAKSNSNKTKPFSIWAATHNAAQLLLPSVWLCWLFSSLKSQKTVFQSRRDGVITYGFFGGDGGCGACALQNNKIGETLCWYKHDLFLHETI